MNDFYENITLTEDELKAAILEGKKKKFFKERSKERSEWIDSDKKSKAIRAQGS